MNIKRLFIGNIPAETQSSDLETEFNKFGIVKLVEVKSKANFANPEILNYFAFISLDIQDNNLNKCIRHFEQNQVHGSYLTVTVARESFLDRLKREREENSCKENIKLNENEHLIDQDVNYFPADNINKRLPTKKIFNDFDFIEPEIEENQANNNQNKNLQNFVQIKTDIKQEDGIVKKSANISIRDGKITIERFAHDSVVGKPILNERHIKTMSEKEKLANQKRLESLNEKQNQYSSKKLIIQKALVSENFKLPNKIVFDNTDYVPEKKTESSNKLFEDDSDDPEAENSFKLQKVFDGMQGEKLLEMQSRFQLDPRFRMDEKFSNDISEQPDKNHDFNTSIQTGSIKSGNFNKKINMVRFDPSKPKNNHLVLQNNKVPKKILKESGEIKNEECKEVSKNQFYEIQYDFKNSFNQVSESAFSLLSLFNKTDTLEETGKSPHQPAKEKILLHRNNYELNNMNISDDEIEVQEINQNAELKISKNDSSETFFINLSDQRLKDGMDFFKAVVKTNEQDNYSEIRNKLRIIINKKINKVKSKKLNQTKFSQKVYKSKNKRIK